DNPSETAAVIRLREHAGRVRPEVPEETVVDPRIDVVSLRVHPVWQRDGHDGGQYGKEREPVPPRRRRLHGSSSPSLPGMSSRSAPAPYRAAPRPCEHLAGGTARTLDRTARPHPAARKL